MFYRFRFSIEMIFIPSFDTSYHNFSFDHKLQEDYYFYDNFFDALKQINYHHFDILSIDTYQYFPLGQYFPQF